MSAETESASTGTPANGSAKPPQDGRGRAIFISYRRDDSEGEAGRLYDDLVRAYGDASVFMDVAGIQPGLDFRQAIDDNVAACGVLLAVIGPTWATITGHDGARRLDNASDYVRLEIASALKRGIPVIPVLVHDAHMPALEQLPDDIKDLRYRNSVELTHARWGSDAPLLISALKSYVASKPARPEATVHATVPVQLPAPQLNPPPAKRQSLALGIALGALTVVVVLALVFFLVLRPRWEARHQAASSTTTSEAIPAPASGTAPASSSTSSPTATTPASDSTPGTANVSSAPTIPPGLIGNWKKVKPNPDDKDGLEQLSVLEFGGQLSVHAYGTCAGRPCDWGSHKAVVHGNSAVAGPWEPRNKPQETKEQRKVSVSMVVNGDSLIATVKNETVGSSGGQVQSLKDWEFRKAN